VSFVKPQITVEDLSGYVQKSKRSYSVINFMFILDFYYYSVLEKATTMTLNYTNYLLYTKKRKLEASE